MSNSFSRPIRSSIVGFLRWATALLVGLELVDALANGRGASGIAEVLFGYLWLGWLFLLGALPVWLLFRWALGRFGRNVGGSPPTRGAVFGVIVWLGAALVLLVVSLVGRTFSPDSQPTPASVLQGFLAVGIFGGLLGSLEGRAIGQYQAQSGIPALPEG